MNTDYRLTRFVLPLLVVLTVRVPALAAQKVGANCLTGGGTNCTAPIPDGSSSGSTALNSVITIPAGSCPSVSRVCVATNIEHSSRGDLTVQLFHGARSHTLVPANSGDTDADISRAFVLETEFDGLNGAGAWNLAVFDSTNGDYGSLNNWTLGLCCGTGCGNGLVIVTPNGALQTTEAGGTAQFNVELSCPAFNQVTIPVSSSDTTEGTTPTTSLVFTAANSQNPQTVTFTGVNDAFFDGDVAYNAVLGTVAVGASFATAVSPADLYNPPSVFQTAGNLPDVPLVNLDNELSSLRINDVSRVEGNSGSSALTFTVSLTPASVGPVTVNYATANGSATAGSDYTATSGALTFTAGQTSKTVTVNVTGDTTIEPNETFVVNLSGASGATLADAQGTGTITNDDLPTLRINDVSRVEGNSGSSPLTFTVSLSPASASPVTVNYATANGSATAGSDYTATSGALTFTAGQTSKTVTVNVTGDTTIEPNETFVVNLSGASGATLADAQGTGTITNDDVPVVLSTLRINDVSRVEGNSGSSPLTFTVSLSPASASPVTVNYATANGSATAGSDYTATSGALTFTAGQTSKTVTVNVTGDTTIEPNETFVVNLSGASGATLADAQGTGTITNDDLPTLRINDVSRVEGNSGSSPLTFTVSLSPASASPVTVNYATANGSATAGSDYTATSGALTFTAGQTSKTVTVNVTGDTTIEPNETFVVNLSGASGATLADAQGTGTITNDDVLTLLINDVKRGEGDSGTSTFVFTATLSQASATPVTVNYATANGSASAGSDYTTTSGVLTFAPGEISKPISVLVAGDGAVEQNETFVVNLSGVSGATLSDGQGLGTILNDDGLILRVTDVSLAEGNSGTTAFIFTVSLTQGAKVTVTVDYATANGSATAGSDYVAKSGMLTFAPGQASQTVVVNVTGDTLLEPNEAFALNLSNGSGATIFDDQGLGTILNDEGSVLRINDVSKVEGNSGTSTFMFTATLSPASATPVTVNYATANGSALAGSDYTAVPVMPLTFSAGQTSKTVVVNVTGDTAAEPDETFTVNLSAAIGATIFDGQGLGTIVADDAPTR